MPRARHLGEDMYRLFKTWREAGVRCFGKRGNSKAVARGDLESHACPGKDACPKQTQKDLTLLPGASPRLWNKSSYLVKDCTSKGSL